MLRLEHGGPLDAEIAPAALYALQGSGRTIRQRARDARGGRARRGAAAGDTPRRSCDARRELDATALALRERCRASAPTLRRLPARPRHRAACAARRAGRSGARRWPSVWRAMRAVLRRARPPAGGRSRAAPAQEMVVVVTAAGTGRRTRRAGRSRRAGQRDDGAARVTARRRTSAPTILFALGVPSAASLASRAGARTLRAGVRRHDTRARRVDTMAAVARDRRRATRPAARSGDDRSAAEPRAMCGEMGAGARTPAALEAAGQR